MKPSTLMTSQNHEKILKNYRSAICKTLKWNKQTSVGCVFVFVFGSLIMVAWWLMHLKFSFKIWQMKVMFAWTTATKRKP
jgi:hypothetical protein